MLHILTERHCKPEAISLLLKGDKKKPNQTNKQMKGKKRKAPMSHTDTQKNIPEVSYAFL